MIQLTEEEYAERIAQARREGAAEVAKRVEAELERIGGPSLAATRGIRAALRGDA